LGALRKTTLRKGRGRATKLKKGVPRASGEGGEWSRASVPGERLRHARESFEKTDRKAVDKTEKRKGLHPPVWQENRKRGEQQRPRTLRVPKNAEKTTLLAVHSEKKKKKKRPRERRREVHHQDRKRGPLPEMG